MHNLASLNLVLPVVSLVENEDVPRSLLFETRTVFCLDDVIKASMPLSIPINSNAPMAKTTRVDHGSWASISQNHGLRDLETPKTLGDLMKGASPR